MEFVRPLPRMASRMLQSKRRHGSDCFREVCWGQGVSSADGPEEEEKMTKINRIAAALGLALAFSMPARAQTDALTMYENFLAQHQTAAQALSANPSLYRSP